MNNQNPKNISVNQCVSVVSYPKYKNSGIEWLGQIPEHWDIKRIKHCCYVKGRVGWKGLNSSEFLEYGYSYLITGTDFKKGKIDFDNCYYINRKRYEEDPYIQLQDKDLLITKDGTIGKLAVVEDFNKPACLNSGIFVVRSLNDEFSTKYLFWLLGSDLFSSYNDFTSYGSTIQHLYQNVFVEFSFPFPSLSEQQAITDFLDRKTAQIDRLVSIKQKQIELLKEERTAVINQAVTKGLNPTVEMKDSSIDWLGEIPEHWKMQKLGRLGIFCKGRGISRTDITDTGLPAITYGDIYTKYDIETKQLLKYTSEQVASNAQKIVSGNLLFTASGETLEEIGKTTLYSGSVPAYAGGDIIILKLNKNVGLFLSYALNSEVGIRQKITYGRGDIIVHISASNLKLLILPIPPVPEQQAIADYLDQQTNRIDTSILKAKTQIELLKEYRTALISEAVTGKIDVRGRHAKAVNSNGRGCLSSQL